MKQSLNNKYQKYNKKVRFIMEYSNYREINSKAAEISFYLLLSLFPFLIFTKILLPEKINRQRRTHGIQH